MSEERGKFPKMEISSSLPTTEIVVYIAQQRDALTETILAMSAATTSARRTEQLFLPPPPPLYEFIYSVARSSYAGPATLLCTAIYVESVVKNLKPKRTRKIKSTGNRLFLAFLIIGSKFLNDQSPGAKDWVEHAGRLFTLEDIMLMERQFLALLRWDLRICHRDYVRCVIPFTRSRIHEISPPLRRVRFDLSKRQQ